MASADVAAAPSTLMISSIPSRCPCDDVLRVINELGFEGAYDFFYMPRRRARSTGLSFGYVFINFKDPLVGEQLTALAQAKRLLFRGKPATLVPAHIQGLDNLMEHFQGKRIMHFQVAPVFHDSVGVSVSVSTGHAVTAALAVPARPVTPGRCSVRPRANDEKSKTRWGDIVDFWNERYMCASSVSSRDGGPPAMSAALATPRRSATEASVAEKQSRKRWSDQLHDETE
eukprot:TRINITY_DN51882_c0_g1_i1.p1 TRINITY_DN51882_c0_g1~~TRINITY_DN51882_c0_g1_i1.p1  ORF type:complete len:229 (-),score=35.25 TRINITY_DN51882_c0_g1_i1:85-771(-)